MDNCTNKTTTDVIDLTDCVFITINIMLMLFICSGNMLTIVTVWITPVLRTVPNMYVVSLAAADFLAGIFLPLQILIFIPSLDRCLNNDKYLCLFRHVSFFVSMNASILSMVSIAIDRAFYIKYPLHYQRLATISKAKICITVTWVISLVIGTIPLYYNNWKPCEGCSVFSVLKKEFQVYIIGSSFILCCIVIACCYVYILLVARHHQKKISKLEIKTSTSNQAHNDMKLIKLFGLVFGIFFICFLPAMSSVLIGQLGGFVPQIVMNIVVPIAVLNSGMNFGVYAMKNKDFRRAFIEMLCVHKG